MTKKDYDRFLYKIDQLNQLVEFINKSPERYQLMISCKNHNDVVDLAKLWGFDIGKRWGES